MSDQQDPKKLPQTVFASILLALICSVICLSTGIILTAINWNNPIWDVRIKSIFILVVVVLLGITVFVAWLFKKRMG